MSDRWDRAWSILPQYLCGLAWLTCGATLAALTITPADALTTARALTALTQPLRIPDLALWFLLAAFGILLPYGVATVFAPLSFVIGDVVRDKLHVRPAINQLAREHLELVASRVRSNLGTSPPTSGIEDVLVLALRQARSPLTSRLEHEAMHFNVQVYCALPTSLLAGLVIYGILGQNIWSGLGGAVFAAGAYVLAIYTSVRGLSWYFESVLWSYLVASAADSPPEDRESSERASPR